MVRGVEARVCVALGFIKEGVYGGVVCAGVVGCSAMVCVHVCVCLLQVAPRSGSAASSGHEAKREAEEAISLQRVPGKGFGALTRGVLQPNLHSMPHVLRTMGDAYVLAVM